MRSAFRHVAWWLSWQLGMGGDDGERPAARLTVISMRDRAD